jgi:hypothetical protein
MFRQIAEFVAALSSALFTGAAVYITFVEHPVWIQSGGELGATEFGLTYPRYAYRRFASANPRFGFRRSRKAGLTL